VISCYLLAVEKLQSFYCCTAYEVAQAQLLSNFASSKGLMFSHPSAIRHVSQTSTAAAGTITVCAARRRRSRDDE